jgi:acylphosphatase
VQGVGYRAFAVRAARALAVRGWVRNRADGSVEALGEADERSLRAWIEELRRGPARGLVTHLEEEPASREELPPEFAVRW